MSPTFILTRLSGFGRGKKDSFTQESVQLGTDSRCDLRFDPVWDKTVSPCHCLLRWRGGELWIEDKSANGTWVEGQRISSDKLSSGSVIELGMGGPKVRVEFESCAMNTRAENASRAQTAPSAQAEPASTETIRAFESPTAGVGSVPRKATPTAAHILDGKKMLLIAGAVVLVLIVGLIVWMGARGGDSDVRLAEAAKNYEQAVGLVVMIVDSKDGQRSLPMATAWAIGPHVFATNSHVAQPVQESLAKGGTTFIVINRHPEIRFRVTKAVVHPKFGEPLENAVGRKPAVAAYDVGLLYVDAEVPLTFKLASGAALQKIDSGARIAYLGFPMEGMAGGGVDFRNPVATMQSGIVTAVTDYFLSKAEFKDGLLLQHSLGAAGGASGSPIFNGAGEVVGILCGGNIVGQVDMASGQAERAPSAVMVNFAQRVDVLKDIYPGYPKN